MSKVFEKSVFYLAPVAFIGLYATQSPVVFAVLLLMLFAYWKENSTWAGGALILWLLQKAKYHGTNAVYYVEYLYRVAVWKYNTWKLLRQYKKIMKDLE